MSLTKVTFSMINGAIVNPIDSGATPGGLVDSTTAFTAALVAGTTVDLGGNTFLVGSLTIPNCTITNGTLKLVSGSRLTVNTGCIFDGVTVDANNSAVNVAAIYVFGGNFNFHNSKVTNIDSAGAVAAQYGIIIKKQPGTGLEKIVFSIRDSEFSNIVNTDDGAPAGSGFCGGVFFFGDEASLANYTDPCKGVIDNCVFDNIWTRTGGGATIDNTDADAIRFYIDGWAESFNVVFPITISNCKFYKIQKSCIKNNGGNGMSVCSMYVKADRVDFTMLAAIRIQSAYDCVINDLTFDGSATYLFALSTKRCQIYNTNLTLASNVTQGLFFQNFGIISANIIVDGGAWNEVGRLIGSNYSSGTTATNVVVSNIAGVVTTPQSPYISLLRFSGITLNNVKFENPSLVVDAVQLSDSDNVLFSNCSFVTARRAIAMDTNNTAVVNITIDGCYLETTGKGIGLRLVTIRPTSGSVATPDGVYIYNTRMKRYTHSSQTNDEFVFVQASNVKIDGLHMLVEQDGANTIAAPTAINLISCTKIQLTNVQYTCNFTFAAGWVGWAALLSSCQYATIYNIHGGCRRGVEFNLTSNCAYNNIAAVVGQTVTAVTGGTNIVAGAELNAVL